MSIYIILKLCIINLKQFDLSLISENIDMIQAI